MSSVLDFAGRGAPPRSDPALSSPTFGRVAQEGASLLYFPRGVAPQIAPTGPGCVPVSLFSYLPLLRCCSPPPCLGPPPPEAGRPPSLPPLNSCVCVGGPVAPSSPVTGCPSRLRSWGPPSGSTPTPGSRSPWAPADGTPGTAARVSGTLPAPLFVSGLPRSASPGCSGAPGRSEVTETVTAPGPWSWSAAGSRWLSTLTSVNRGGGGLASLMGEYNTPFNTYTDRN